MATWRVGSRVPQHVYRGDTPVCTVPAHTAAYIVRALNLLEALHPDGPLETAWPSLGPRGCGRWPKRLSRLIRTI